MSRKIFAKKLGYLSSQEDTLKKAQKDVIARGLLK